MIWGTTHAAGDRPKISFSHVGAPQMWVCFGLSDQRLANSRYLVQAEKRRDTTQLLPDSL